MSSDQFRFEFSGNTITKIEAFDTEDGVWEVKSPDANEQWTYDSVNNIVTEVETNGNIIETTTYTDVDTDGIYLKGSGVYSNTSGNQISDPFDSLSSGSDNLYRFQFSGDSIILIERFDEDSGTWEVKSQDANEQWLYDSLNNVVTEIETEGSITETNTYTDVNNDGVFIKGSGVYSDSDGNQISRSDDLYRFEFSGTNVTKVEEFEDGFWQTDSIDSNETWSYDSATNTVTKIELEHGFTKTYLFTDTDNDGVFVKSSSAYSDGVNTYQHTSSSDYIGSDDNDYLESSDDDDYLSGGNGNDYLDGRLGDDDIDGGAGFDTFVLSINESELSNISKKKFGGYLVSSTDGDDSITNIEQLAFLDGNKTIDFLLANKAAPTISFNGNTVNVQVYSGAVDYLEYELLGEVGDDIASGSLSNDFMNLLAGNDAADGGDGDDVLDGGLGSNFLTGGKGDDTFFLDGRNGEVTWSTVTDFSSGNSTSGDNVNIWGWQEGVSQLLLTENNAGANGFKGLTLHYDLDNDGSIDTSITFTGITSASELSISSQSVSNQGYLLVA